MEPVFRNNKNYFRNLSSRERVTVSPAKVLTSGRYPFDRLENGVAKADFNARPFDSYSMKKHIFTLWPLSTKKILFLIIILFFNKKISK